jgi:hypothetical protein
MLGGTFAQWVQRPVRLVISKPQFILSRTAIDRTVVHSNPTEHVAHGTGLRQSNHFAGERVIEELGYR